MYGLFNKWKGGTYWVPIYPLHNTLALAKATWGGKEGATKIPQRQFLGYRGEHQPAKDNSTQPAKEGGNLRADLCIVTLLWCWEPRGFCQRKVGMHFPPKGESKQVSFSHGTLGHLPTGLLDRLLFVTLLGLGKITCILHFTSLRCTLVFLDIPWFNLASSSNSSKDIFSSL